VSGGSGSGGAPSTGGSAGGGGTMAASGGSAGTEGARDAGEGAGTGGSTGRADSGAASDGAVTAGCNAATWPMGGTANPQTLDVTNNGTTTSRQFYFALPATYSSSRAYRAVFAWHYAGGTALIIASNGGGGGRYYGLQPLMPDTLFVTGQGLMDAQGRTGWPNTNGQDVAFARALVQWVNTNFCVDTSRIMSTGFSYGAIMSHTLACQMPDVFRAVGVMSGALIGRATGCVNHAIAAWLTHGADDTAAIGGVEFTGGESRARSSLGPEPLRHHQPAGRSRPLRRLRRLRCRLPRGVVPSRGPSHRHGARHSDIRAGSHQLVLLSILTDARRPWLGA
jgi:hypothetical protein